MSIQPCSLPLRMAVIAVLLIATLALADETLIPAMHHLRWGNDREWSSFPEEAEGKELLTRFQAQSNATEQTLRLRHRDLRQQWEVWINGTRIGKLPLDENEMVTYWPIRAGLLKNGDNDLRIACTGGAADDVEIGEIALLPIPRQAAVSQATLNVEVVEEDAPIPCRVTIADERGALVDLGIASDQHVAVRPGVVYTADGKAQIKLPGGKYTIYAGRGFEYSLASAQITLKPGDSASKRLAIQRVVPTPGYVSSDTHIHTLTYSRHGDATIHERMLTLAGEGIELPVCTEHNLQIDYAKFADQMGVRKYFTPIMGNEVTTETLGHFNVFPIPPNQRLINWRRRDWKGLGESLGEVPGDPVIILNHARDIHGGFRPFDPVHHLSVTGETLDSVDPPANAMEVINSGATQTDPMRLYRDWFGMLNHGHKLTPIGGSDSHDVSRFIVGQARTYVKCDDSEAGHIDVEAARKAFREGRVNVSYGLLTEIKVQGQFGPGDLVTPAKKFIEVEVNVYGPAWTKARRVTLFANGVPIQEADIPIPPHGEYAGRKWTGRWMLDGTKHDFFLVAVASGPGVSGPFWPTAKAYQPMSIDFQGYVLGSTGAVYVDVDGSGKFDSAFEYASRLVEANHAELRHVIAALQGYDAATAAQAAAMLREKDPERFDREYAREIAGASQAIRDGFNAYVKDRDASAR
jgi:hypothetical protein